MKKQLIGIGVAALMFAGVVGANATAVVDEFTADGWIQFADDDVTVSPGGGGQAFDAEYLFYKLEDGALSIGLQTGFNVREGWQTYNGGSDIYYSGDLALSFDGDDTSYEYGFDFGLYTENYFTIGDKVSMNGTGKDTAGLYENVVWDSGVYPGHSSSSPFAMEGGSLVVDNDGINTSNTNAGYDSSRNTYWRTVTLDFALLGMDFSGFDAHWTMSCGNDVIEGHAPVPEPATMLLFGAGLMGLAGTRLRRKQK